MQWGGVGPAPGSGACDTLEMRVHALFPSAEPNFQVVRNLLCKGFDAGSHQRFSEFLSSVSIEKILPPTNFVSCGLDVGHKFPDVRGAVADESVLPVVAGKQKGNGPWHQFVSAALDALRGMLVYWDGP